MNISLIQFIKNWDQFLIEDNLDILKTHLTWSLLLKKLPLISKRYEDLKFNFMEILSGLKEMKPYGKDIEYINSQLGELLD